MPFDSDTGFPHAARPTSVAVRFLVRAILAGLVFYFNVDPERSENLKTGAVGFIALAVWSYYDGWLAVRRWPWAFLEGTLLYVASVCVANGLVAVLGIP